MEGMGQNWCGTARARHVRCAAKSCPKAKPMPKVQQRRLEITTGGRRVKVRHPAPGSGWAGAGLQGGNATENRASYVRVWMRQSEWAQKKKRVRENQAWVGSLMTRMLSGEALAMHVKD